MGWKIVFPPPWWIGSTTRTFPVSSAEHIRIGGIKMAEPSGYDVIIDRISHDIEFYRAYLKNAVLGGAIVINNPVLVERRMISFSTTPYPASWESPLSQNGDSALPQSASAGHHGAIDAQPFCYPLNWDEVFDYIGFPAFLKPFSGGGWKNVFKVNSRDEFFHAYDQTGSLCMTLQTAVEFDEYFRCYVVGQEKVRVMKYDPKLPHHLRYVKDGVPSSQALHDRLVKDALTLCRALGYDLNTVEFAVENGVPFAIDFLNPAPDADVHSVGDENFEWIVENMAQLAIDKALSGEEPASELHWSRFLAAAEKKATAAGT